MPPSLFQLSDPKLCSLGPVICPPYMDDHGDPSHPTQVSVEGTPHCILPMIPGEGQVLGSRPLGQEGKMGFKPPNLVMVVPMPTMSPCPQPLL